MKQVSIALVGNPNIGKTSLFNALTGAHQKVGNWPGVTVEKKHGFFEFNDNHAEIVDLPGIYSLAAGFKGLDEKIARHHLEKDPVDVIINIVDACNLNRNLQLTNQLRGLGRPMVVVLNMSDSAKKRGIDIDSEELSRRLGVPVVTTVATQKVGLDQLIDELTTLLQSDANIDSEQATVVELADDQTQDYTQRYHIIERMLDGVVTMDLRPSTLTDTIDKVVLNRWLGIPIFLLVMYLLFTFAVNLGSVFIDFFDILFGVFLVDGSRWLLELINTPALLTTLIADGLGGGITLVATFIPVIGFLYLGLSVLEDSGYMSRAAFVADRLMSTIGLPGNAFVPLIVGFGCNVPAVMATRTLGNLSDRLLTIAMSPFMSCGARLTVYVLFAAAFFPKQGQNIVFLLYLMGIVVAVATGFIFRKQLFQVEATPSAQEMPAYHQPSVRNLFIATWIRLKGFIFSAGKAIVSVVIVLSFFNSIGTDGSFGNEDSEKSVLSVIGKKITPIFSPIGISEDNWPATVGLFTGMFAKEAIVGTLDALYIEEVDSGTSGSGIPDIGAALGEASGSIIDGLSDLQGALLDPLGIAIGDVSDTERIASDQAVKTGTLTQIAALFESQLAAFAYLAFILLYAPCVAVVGAMVRESGIRWALMVFSWATLVGYFVASWIYQIGSFSVNPLFSSIYLVVSLLVMLIAIHFLKRIGRTVAQEDQIPLLNL